MITIIDSKGNSYDLTNYRGIKCLKFVISSPSPRRETNTVTGRNGIITQDTTLDGRSLRASFAIEAHDYLDYQLLRNEAFKLFDAKTEFYIIDNREMGKRWLVRTASAYTPERLGLRLGSFDIDFVSDSPYAESVYTTKDELLIDAGYLQYGQGLITEDLTYKFSSSSFQIFNAGDILIDPRELPLVINFKGASNSLKITNVTTGDSFQYNGSTNSTDTIILDGVTARKNGLSIFGDTNKKLLTIAEGWNDFTITGASTGFSIDFDYRFYYL